MLLSRNLNVKMTPKRHIHAIYGASEVVDNVISGQNVKTAEFYMMVNFEVVVLRLKYHI